MQAAADREQKMLEAATEGMLSRIGDIKASIAGLVAKLENDPYLNWDEFIRGSVMFIKRDSASLGPWLVNLGLARCISTILGNNSGRRKPSVDVVPTVLAAAWPLL